jgi:hypothetical protein
MHTVLLKSKNCLFVIFLLISVNKKSIWGSALTSKSKIIYWFQDLAKNWVKNFKNTIFRPFFRIKSKMTKHYTNITTVSQVGKQMIFSVLTFFPVLLMYKISRKNPTLIFFACFDIRVTVVILYTQNCSLCDLTHIWGTLFICKLMTSKDI